MVLESFLGITRYNRAITSGKFTLKVLYLKT